jgi:hypothetical protein
LRRLRVSISDPAMSETTTLLRAGATFLVLRMAEAGTVMPDLRLENPVRAIGEVSQDITGRSLLRLAGGRQISALDIQRESLAKARDFTSNHAAEPVSTRVLRLWERALDAIGTGNLGAVAREIDWVIKYQLVEQHRQNMPCPCRPRRSPRPTWPTTTFTAATACTTSWNVAARSSEPRAMSTSSRPKPSRRPTAATGRRADHVPDCPQRGTRWLATHRR